MFELLFGFRAFWLSPGFEAYPTQKTAKEWPTLLIGVFHSRFLPLIRALGLTVSWGLERASFPPLLPVMPRHLLSTFMRRICLR